MKKMMLLATAAGALIALAIPATASAQLLTDPAGTTLKKGALVTATSFNLVTTTALGHLTCGKVTIHAEVTENKGSTSSLKSSSVTTEECHLITTPTLVTHDAIITDAAATLHIAKQGVGTTTATFVADIPGIATCHEAGVPGVTYTAGTDMLTVKGALSGPCGAAEIHGDFTLETANGAPVIID